MKFVCDRCQTKYSIADEKVRGKILKVRCKACTNIITVREESAGPVGAAPRRPPSVSVPTVGAAAPRAAARPPAAPAARPPAPPPPPAAPDDGVQWYLALDGNRSGPFTRRQLVDKIAPFSADADLHVWNEQLGSWKSPGQVPVVAADLAARKPTGPPPFPGAPRRPPPSPPLPSLTATVPPRPTGAHAVAAAIGPGVGLKLPPPSGPPGGRRITGPMSRPAVLSAAGLAPTSSQVQVDEGLDVDPSTLLETPAPQLHMLHGLGSNGFGGAHAADPAAPNGAAATASDHSDKSDVLNTLNLASASASGASPRLLSSESIVGWQPGAAQASGARQRGGRMILAFLAVIGLVVVVLFLNVTKKAKPALAPLPQSTVSADPMAGLTDKPAGSPPAAVAPTPVEPTAPAPELAPPAAGHGKGKAGRGPHGRATGPTSPPPPPAAGPAAGPATAAPVADANARYRDTSRPGLAISGGGGVSRPAPSQSDISRVINNNRGGIKNCYQRALLRDSSLTHGKITVQVTIGISGRVKRTGIDGPPQFRSLDPCIKEVVGRWAFPQAGDEYGTEFVYVFQGNE
jgi:predicted Zn finger-like uncharacterized protein